MVDIAALNSTVRSKYAKYRLKVTISSKQLASRSLPSHLILGLDHFGSLLSVFYFQKNSSHPHPISSVGNEIRNFQVQSGIDGVKILTLKEGFSMTLTSSSRPGCMASLGGLGSGVPFFPISPMSCLHRRGGTLSMPHILTFTQSIHMILVSLNSLSSKRSHGGGVTIVWSGKQP